MGWGLGGGGVVKNTCGTNLQGEREVFLALKTVDGEEDMLCPGRDEAFVGSLGGLGRGRMSRVGDKRSQSVLSDLVKGGKVETRVEHTRGDVVEAAEGVLEGGSSKLAVDL